MRRAAAEASGGDLDSEPGALSLAGRYAALVVRLRWIVVLAWIGVAVALTVSLPTLSETGGTGGLRGLASSDSPAIQAEIRSFEKFGFPVLTRTAVVQRSPEGLSAETQLRIVSNAIEFNLDRPPELQRIEFALPIINDPGVLPTREYGTTAITYMFYRPDVGFGRQTGLAHQYANRYANRPEDHRVGETGVVPGRIAQLVILRERLRTVEIVTVCLIGAIVAVNFLAIGAPLLTLLTAGLALAVVVRLAGWVGARAGVEVPGEIEPLMVALLLGIITDYSIFFLSGMRERLRRGEHRLDAARRSAADFAPIVTTAGLTVAAGSLALLVAGVGAFRSFGPGMAITILISLAVAVTFVPAALAIVGRAVFWPMRSRSTEGRQVIGSGLVRVLTRRRGALATVVIVGAALATATLPARNLELGFSVIDSLPASYEAKYAADAAAQGFFPGILSPTVLLLEGEGLGEQRDGLNRLQGLLEQRPGIAAVAGPANLPSPLRLGAVVSTGGDAARYVIFLNDDPLSAEAVNHLQQLRRDMPSLLETAGIEGAAASYAGDTALAEATVTQTEADLGKVVLVATGLGFVLMVVFLRSIVAPLYLMVANLLAVGAAVGLTTLVFQGTEGGGGLTFYVPFAGAVLVVALGSDYSIFGIGYIWAEARHRPLVEAIRTAVPRSTRAITAAGITLAASFAALAVVPMTPFREFAFLMSVGILIDVLVVRALLVPSLVTLFGTASAWPGRALRRVTLPELPEDRVPTPALAASGASPSPASRPRSRPRWEGHARFLLGALVLAAHWARQRRRVRR